MKSPTSPPVRVRRAALSAATLTASLALSTFARAEVPPQTTVFRLPASNGHGALMLDLQQKRLTHFREHLFAAEEPLLDGNGDEVWQGSTPLAVPTRDLLYDAYFGLRANGNQEWLTGAAVDTTASGYLAHTPGARGGTGILHMRQSSGALALDQHFFMPRAFPHAGFVMTLTVKNDGASTATGVQVFSLHNFHLGYGRPGAMSDIGENGETASYDAFSGDLSERGFAGVVVARPLGAVAHHAGSWGGAPAAQNLFQIVQAGGSGDFPDLVGDAATHDETVSGFQFDVGDLAPGAEATVGIVFAHHGDPFAANAVQGWLDGYVGANDGSALLAAEVAGWQALQSTLALPSGLGSDDETLVRHAAALLEMAQVRESTSYLREWLSQDGEPRYTRFGTTLGAPPATLPATVSHRGYGAVIASLPPGEWTVSWSRDAAYAVAAMATLGMQQQARDALGFYLGAESGRFQSWSELSGYGLPPYLVSLTRYHGFGVEETDYNAFGPNLEFDGFGLFLWALHTYERATGDTSLVDQSFARVADEVADPILALIDPATGLLRADSSIWETHWNGRQRQWTYTNVTAARGLCDAADLADRVGDGVRAATYRAAGMALRQAIAQRLTDPSGALASNAEELAVGSGYWDAAVLDAIAMGLFDPHGRIASATLAGLDAHLAVAAGAGWSRNDDRFDHAGTNDLSPWGSEYDSAEWVVTDLRGAVATWLAGDVARSDRLVDWVRDQALANYLEPAETFDEGNGTYKFNAPMMGFGAGAYALAWAARSAGPDPACGAYFDEGAGGAGGGGGGGAGGAGAGGASGGAAAGGAAGDGGEDGGCGCYIVGGGASGSVGTLLAALIGALAVGWRSATKRAKTSRRAAPRREITGQSGRARTSARRSRHR